MHRRADLWGALFDRGRQVCWLDSVRVEVCVCVCECDAQKGGFVGGLI